MKGPLCFVACSLLFTLARGQYVVINGRFKQHVQQVITLDCDGKMDTLLGSLHPFSVKVPTRGLPLQVTLYDYDLKLAAQWGKPVAQWDIFPKSGVILIDSDFSVTMSDSDCQKKFLDFSDHYKPITHRRDSLLSLSGLPLNANADEGRRKDSIFGWCKDTANKLTQQYIVKNKDNPFGAYLYTQYFCTSTNVPALE